jgi:TRAP-type mannitol/chloroaromatic compound transport system permease small subunit
MFWQHQHFNVSIKIQLKIARTSRYMSRDSNNRTLKFQFLISLFFFSSRFTLFWSQSIDCNIFFDILKRKHDSFISFYFTLFFVVWISHTISALFFLTLVPSLRIKKFTKKTMFCIEISCFIYIQIKGE